MESQNALEDQNFHVVSFAKCYTKLLRITWSKGSGKVTILVLSVMRRKLEIICFFLCLTAKYICSLLAYSLGTDCRPRDIDQYWIWVHNILPQGSQMHAVGLSAVCWAIWRVRNTVCFDKKRIKTPTEIIFMMCSFLTYWVGMLRTTSSSKWYKAQKLWRWWPFHFTSKMCNPTPLMIVSWSFCWLSSKARI